MNEHLSETVETISIWYVLLCLIFLIAIIIIGLVLLNTHYSRYKNIQAIIREEHCFPIETFQENVNNKKTNDKKTNDKKTKDNNKKHCYYILSYYIDNEELKTTYPMLNNQNIVIGKDNNKMIEISYDTTNYSSVGEPVDLFLVNIITIFIVILLIAGTIGLYKYRKSKVAKHLAAIKLFSALKKNNNKRKNNNIKNNNIKNNAIKNNDIKNNAIKNNAIKNNAKKSNNSTNKDSNVKTNSEKSNNVKTNSKKSNNVKDNSNKNENSNNQK